MSDTLKPKPAVVLNSSALLAPLTGIGRYVHELAQALHDLEVPLRHFVGGRWRDQLPAVQSGDGKGRQAVVQRVANIPGARYWNRRLMNYQFGKGVKSRRADVYHEPNYLSFDFDGPVVVTSHDASWVRYPEAHPAVRVKRMNEEFPRSLERAQRIVVVSDFVAREMVEIFGVAQSRLRTVHHGVSPRFRPAGEAATREFCTRVNIQHGHYVLAVGTLEPRKNLAVLLDAYKRLPPRLAESFPLVVAGATGWNHAAVDHQLLAMQRAGQIRLLGHVAEADLPLLYAASALFVYPSIYEGFGLPPLEAMASGVPVVVADRASLPEVVGNAAIRMDPSDPVALSEHLTELLEDPALRLGMARSGLARAQTFTWQKCAEETLAVYREVLV